RCTMVKTNVKHIPPDPQSHIPGTRTIGIHARRRDELVRRVQQGFSFNRLLNFEKASGLTRERMAQFVAIPTRTLSRRQVTGRLLAEESDRLLRASRIFEMVVDLF